MRKHLSNVRIRSIVLLLVFAAIAGGFLRYSDPILSYASPFFVAYTFSGPGTWTENAKWAPSRPPLDTLNAGDTATINGTGANLVNGPAIIVNNGGVLNNNTVIAPSSYFGIQNSPGTSLTINSGGVFNNIGAYAPDAPTNINSGGTVNNTGVFGADKVILAVGGTLTNNSPGKINWNVNQPFTGNLTNGTGTVDVHDNPTPAITGNYNNGAGKFDIGYFRWVALAIPGGAGKLTTTGTATLSGTYGFYKRTDSPDAPMLGEQFTVIQANGGVIGTFTNNTVAVGAVFANAYYFPNSVVIKIEAAPPAAPIIVTNTIDGLDSTPGVCDAQCTLREAVIAANVAPGANTINFAIPNGAPGCLADVCTITLQAAGGAIAIGSDVTIIGSGANKLTVSGGGLTRVFSASSGVAAISDMRITGGASLLGSNMGGGLEVFGAGNSVTINRVHFDTNTATGSLGGAIGISSAGAVTINNSTFSGNTAASGGAISNAGGTLTVTNSTFSDNRAAAGGGAVNSQDPGTNTALRHVTMTLNRALTVGMGAVRVSGGACTMGNSIAAGNFLTDGVTANDGTGGCTDGPGNLVSGNPLLGPLQNNGGTTPTHALTLASPARDTGDQPFTVTTLNLVEDQRGAGFPRVINGFPDNGAYEFLLPPNQPPVNTVPGPQTIPASTTLTFSSANSNQVSISDPDAGANPVQVTIASNSTGVLTLSGIAGLSFSQGDGTNDVQMIFTGTITNINNALNGLTFNPPAGTGIYQFIILTNDQGNVGTPGPLQDQDEVTINVQAAAATTTTLASVPNPSSFNQSTTFTATVAPVPSGGTVTFIEGGTCGAPLVTLAGPTAVNGSGQAAFSTAALSVGPHTIVACYSGNASFAASSGSTLHSVTLAASTTTITSDSPDPSVFGQNYSVVVTVAPVAPSVVTPTGSVAVTDGTNNCVIVLAAGTGNCTLPSTSPGAKTLTATYGGNGLYLGSSDTDAHTVNKAGTTTTVTSDAPDPSVVGQQITVSYTVVATPPGAGTPTGNVVVTISGGAETCTGTVAAGSCTMTLTSAGARTINAAYAGDANFNLSSNTAPHQVNKADTTTGLVAAPNPSTYGQNLTMTATVTTNAPGSGTPVGTVNFSDGATPIASCQNVAVNGSGIAACTISSLNAGVGKALSAVYSGNANFNGSTGGTAQTINKAPLAVAAEPKTKVYGSANPTLTYQISGFVLGQTLATSDVSGTPAISTTATAGSNVGSYPINITAGTLVSNNYSFGFTDSTLQVTLAPLSVTADNKSKTYGSANPSLTHQITGFVLGQTLATSGVTGTPAISTTATASSPVGTYPISITAGSLASGNYSFNFTDGTLTVTPAQLTVTADNFSRVYGQANPPLTYQFSGFVLGQTLATSGVTGTPAISTTAALFSAPGAYPITVTQGTLASANYSFAFVNGTATVAQAASAITITNPVSLIAPTVVGQAYAVNFTVSAVAPGSGVPTGTVTVSDGGATCTATLVAANNGVGSCSLTSTTPGNKTITASYAGDTNFTGSVSAGIAHQVVISITGNIKQFVTLGSNTNLAGVTVTLTVNGVAAATTATTDASGNYAFGLLVNNANIVITPSGLGKTYEPISRTYSNVTNNIAGANFIAYDFIGLNALPRELKVLNTVGTPGQPVTVPLTINSQGNETAVSFTLAFDQALLGVPTSAVCGTGFAGCTVAVFNTGTPGRVGVTVTRAAAFAAGVREVVRVTFPTSVNTAGSAQITFADTPVAKRTNNSDGDPLPTLYTGGFVSFTPDLEGDVVGPNGASPGGDGVLSNDVTIVRQMALGLIQPTAAQFRNADAAPRSTLGDGCPINSADVTQVSRYNLGLDPPTAAGGLAAPIPGGCAPTNTRGGADEEPARDDEVDRPNGAARAVRVMSTNVVINQQVSVAFELDSLGNESSMSFALNFNPNVLSYASAAPGAGVPSGTNLGLNTNQVAQGRLGVLLDATTPYVAGTRQILTVTFQIAPGAAAGQYPITFSSNPTPQSTSSVLGALLPTAYQTGFVSVGTGQAFRFVRAVNSTVNSGSNVVVPFQLDSAGDEASLSFTVNFDPAKLTFASAAPGAGVPAGTTLSLNTSQIGQGRLGVLLDATNTYAMGTRQILTVNFTTAPNQTTSATTPITFSSTPATQTVSNAQGALLQTFYSAGNVVIINTAAGVRVSGRVTSPGGQGIRNATVTITDSSGSRRSATTGSFGIYTFDDVEAGRSYIVAVSSKRFRFTARSVNVTDSLANLDFAAME